MKKYILVILLLLPTSALAQFDEQIYVEPEIFKAKIVEVLEERVQSIESEIELMQQHLLLIGTDGSWQDREFEVNSINDLEVLSAQEFAVGDKVVVSYSVDFENNDNFAIIDVVRTSSLWYVFLIFVLLTIIIGKWKGFRSLLSLLFSFLVIFYFIIPNIFNGANPVLISLIGGMIITPFIIYFTEGWSRKSHAGVISIYISLFATGILAWTFIRFSSLSGAASEEIMFLVGNSGVVDFRGLLLAGIIIGSLGVLDDLVISQISTVEEISNADKNLSAKELYNRASRVGISHLGSMTNTLFLAYAGVSLPLLLLFYIQQPPFMTFGEIMNSELIAVEIIRTLVGSIGLILAMPISTFLAIKLLNRKKRF
jgi:uncharacterized membrane protein